jgi:triosephosphate isomerase
MRIPLIAGNWKMYKNLEESIELASTLKSLVKDVDESKAEIAICPVFVNLQAVAGVIKGSNIMYIRKLKVLLQVKYHLQCCVR